ncbi:hypothetical protein F5146DRAFT_56406 [Armillaria mellea]|nr:hypothetical protein F5146DRAFT_56406 [Armillaria mellea]
MRSLPRYSYFADCKLYIRTRLLALAFSNFWNSHSRLDSCEDVTMRLRKTGVVSSRMFMNVTILFLNVLQVRSCLNTYGFVSCPEVFVALSTVVISCPSTFVTFHVSRSVFLLQLGLSNGPAMSTSVLAVSTPV